MVFISDDPKNLSEEDLLLLDVSQSSHSGDPEKVRASYLVYGDWLDENDRSLAENMSAMRGRDPDDLKNSAYLPLIMPFKLRNGKLPELQKEIERGCAVINGLTHDECIPVVQIRSPLREEAYQELVETDWLEDKGWAIDVDSLGILSSMMKSPAGKHLLPRAVRLSVSGDPRDAGHIGAEDLACLEKMPHLRSLDLSFDKIDAGALSHLSHVPNLRSLHLFESSIPAGDLAELRHVGDLRTINTSSCSPFNLELRKSWRPEEMPEFWRLLDRQLNPHPPVTGIAQEALEHVTENSPDIAPLKS